MIFLCDILYFRYNYAWKFVFHKRSASGMGGARFFPAGRGGARVKIFGAGQGKGQNLRGGAGQGSKSPGRGRGGAGQNMSKSI